MSTARETALRTLSNTDEFLDSTPSCLHVGSSSSKIETPRYSSNALRARLGRSHSEITTSTGIEN